jgi:GT2 family glycosyltransferase
VSVSIVIPTKDRLRSLQSVLPTYLAQPETAEVVVVVDGSTDGTLEYITQLATQEPRLRFLDNGVNRGGPYSKNAGIDAVTCEHVFIGEDDVELTPGFLRTLLEHRETSGADVIAGRTIWRYETETAEDAIERTDRLPGPAVDAKRIMIDMNVRIEDDTCQVLIAGPMLAPSAVLRSVRFDEQYKANAWRDETDFQLSAQEAGYTLASCPHAICFNYMIANDRGGVHATIGWKRLFWVTVNNWRFVRKHRDFLEQRLPVGNHVRYVAQTSASVFWSEMLLPRLVLTKRRLLGQTH